MFVNFVVCSDDSFCRHTSMNYKWVGQPRTRRELFGTRTHLSVHESQYSGSFHLLVRPCSASPRNGFGPELEGFSGLKCHTLVGLVRPTSPVHLARLSLAKEGNEVATADRERYVQQTSDDF